MQAVVVVGGGAGGIALAHHLARVGGPVPTLIEGRRWGGPAYANPAPCHLLNVPAARMGLNPEDPSDFLRWLEAQGEPAPPRAFLPRSTYGRYLLACLEGLQTSGRVQTLSGFVVGLEALEGGGWCLRLADERWVAARWVVLAPGPFPPSHPPGVAAALRLAPPGAYVGEPWRQEGVPPLDPEARVGVIGTGLTAIDLALGLEAQGHRGPIWLLGRRGQLPGAHAPGPLPHEPPPLLASEGLGPAEAWARLRGAARKSPAGWRGPVDAMRDQTQGLWASWSLAQRRSFLRHARGHWEVLRHRMAPSVAEAVSDALATGRWRLLAGALTGLRPEGGALRLSYRPRGGGPEELLWLDRAYNATGPEGDARRLEDPLIRDLLASGLAQPDPLGLGLVTGPQGELVGAQGQLLEGLWTLGALRRGALWESNALPELRVQAQALARLLTEGSAALG